MANSPGLLLESLPAIYQAPELAELHVFLQELESVLLGGPRGEGEGLGEKIRNIPSLFDPLRTPLEFLPWLAQWVALSQAEALPQERLRPLIANSVWLYARRGTKAYLHEMLRYFLPDELIVGREDIVDHGLKGLVIGAAIVGRDSWLGGDQPFCFLVKIGLKHREVSLAERKRIRQESEAMIRSVVDLAKPAHTSYRLQWKWDLPGEDRLEPDSSPDSHLGWQLGMR